MKFKFLKKEEPVKEEPPEVLQKKEEPESKEPELPRVVFDYLKSEFRAEKDEGLQVAVDATKPPLSILHSEDETYSLWHRMPLRGESGSVHIPDFVIFEGTRRMPPRNKNPDILIECRRLDEKRSNRTDPRAVREMLGEALDTLPGLVILVTNRPLSEYAKSIAKQFGIKLANTMEDNASYEIFKHMVSNDLETREKLYSKLDKNILKLEGKFKVAEVKESTSKSSDSGTATSRRKKSRSELRVLVAKALENNSNSVRDLSNILNADPNLILNELYALEREGRAKVKKESKSGDPRESTWKLVRKKSSK